MHIQGHRTLAAPRDAVFAAICDPTVLFAVIPGCQDIERVGDDYRGRIALRLPGVAGTYRTEVRLVDSDPPAYGALEGRVEGSLGSIRGRASFRLVEADGGTDVAYDGQAEIGGPLARLDGRFVEALASSLVGQGLGNLETELRRSMADEGAGASAAGSAASDGSRA